MGDASFVDSWVLHVYTGHSKPKGSKAMEAATLSVYVMGVV